MAKAQDLQRAQDSFSGNRNFSIKENPFVKTCEGTKRLPPISKPALRIDADPESDSYLVTFRFRSAAKVSVKLSEDRIQPLVRSQANVYNLSLSRTASGGSISLDLILEVGGEKTEYRLLADEEGTNATLSPVLTSAQYRNLCIRNQIWAGIGSSMFSYNQNIPDRSAKAGFTSFTDGSFHVEGRSYLTPTTGVIASYKNAPGKVDKGEVPDVEETRFAWKILEVAGQFRKPDWLIEKGDLIVYPYVRVGLQHHWMQRIGIDDNNAVFFQDYELTDVALGGGFNVFSKEKYFFEAYMNYKFPLKEKNIAVSPKLMFDGAVGVGRRYSGNWVAGVFWYGHWDEYSYDSGNSRDSKSGDVRFIFSNLDIRLGYLF